jgi:hypothetical protein
LRDVFLHVRCATAEELQTGSPCAWCMQRFWCNTAQPEDSVALGLKRGPGDSWFPFGLAKPLGEGSGLARARADLIVVLMTILSTPSSSLPMSEPRKYPVANVR